MDRSPLVPASNERRSKLRFPLARKVRYEFVQSNQSQCGQGEILNISSSGVLLQAEHELQPGTKLRLSISWPIKLNETASIKLVAEGKIVWAKEKKVAVRLTSHEFRLLGSKL